MFRTNIAMFIVFLFVIFRIIYSEQYTSDDKYCESKACVKMSDCKSLNYNYTTLKQNETLLNQYVRWESCGNKNGDTPMVCCSNYTNETDQFIGTICGRNSIVNKILNGNDAQIDEFPWMALLEYSATNSSDNIFHCAGSLINNRYILTAAHCLDNKLELKRVHLGKYDSKKEENCRENDCAHPTVVVEIDDKAVHPNYTLFNKPNTINSYDIALIRLSRTVSYTHFIQPICLPKTIGMTASSGNDTLYISGWGKGSTNSNKQKLKVAAIPFSDCAYEYDRYLKTEIMDSGSVCARGNYMQGACSGDSGGPLMAWRAQENKFNTGIQTKVYAIEGIITSGYNICDLQKQNITHSIVSTRVSDHEGWIEGEINKMDAKARNNSNNLYN